MNENPYAELLKMMQKEGAKMNTPSICLGEVIKGLPDIIIQIGDLKLYKEDIKIADYLVTQANLKGKLKFIEALREGDEVAILPLEDQNTYIILCRVV